MNILKSLFGGNRHRNKRSNSPATPVRRRAQAAASVAPATSSRDTAAKDDRIPDYLDFDDTMELESPFATMDEADPYQTETWELEHETETRKLKQLGVNKKPVERDPSNPYNTGVRRRGWKA